MILSLNRLIQAFSPARGKTRSARLTLEQKLEVLARCGIRLAEPYTANDLLRSSSREEYEIPGFDSLLVGLGRADDTPPWRDRCVNVWHFDTECIQGHGSYARIAERMKALARGALPIDEIRDYVNVDKKIAWLAFHYQDEEMRIDLHVENDWVDTSVFPVFVRLLGESARSRIYLYYDLGGQDCILACVTKAQFAHLKREGIPFKPL